MGDTVLVLGAGTGGLTAANRLRENLNREHRVVLIDRKGAQSYWPSYPWLTVKRREPEEITRDFGRLQQKGIEFVRADVSRIDPERATVATSAGEFPYDYLIIALGADLDPDAVPGFSEHVYNVYELDDSIRLRDRLEHFNGGTVTIFISSVPIKCEGAPYELALVLEGYFARRGVRDRVRLRFVAAEPRPAPSLPQAVGDEIRFMLRDRGIEYLPGMRVQSVRSGPRLELEDGRVLESDLVLGVPVHRGNQACRRSGLANAAGWVEVDGGTLATAFERVWAVGDTTETILPSGGVLPRNGAVAHLQASVAADRVRGAVLGRPVTAAFQGRGACVMDTGRGKGRHISASFFYKRPPATIYTESRLWFAEKVLIEQFWLNRWV